MMIDPSQAYDFILTALCIWREARNQPIEAKRAVGWVIRNRAMNPSWWGGRGPSPWSDVVLRPYQFSSFNASDPNAAKWPRVSDKAEWDAWLQCLNVTQGVWESSGADPTLNATHYHDKSVLPSWTAKMTPTITIGAFCFYRETL